MPKLFFNLIILLLQMKIKKKFSILCKILPIQIVYTKFSFKFEVIKIWKELILSRLNAYFRFISNRFDKRMWFVKLEISY